MCIDGVMTFLIENGPLPFISRAEAYKPCDIELKREECTLDQVNLEYYVAKGKTGSIVLALPSAAFKNGAQISTKTSAGTLAVQKLDRSLLVYSDKVSTVLKLNLTAQASETILVTVTVKPGSDGVKVDGKAI
jgi:hypothetical protein